MGKFTANLFLFVLAIALSIFTGARTIDLLNHWLPANQEIYKWLALAGFEGGFYFWAFYFSSGAEGAPQRALALIMVVIDFLGVAVATVTDLLLIGAADGQLPPIDKASQQALVVFIGLVLVLNVAAFLGCKLVSPAKLRQWAVQDADDQIVAAELAAIRREAPIVAVGMAPLKAKEWARQTWAQVLPGEEPPALPERAETAPAPVVESKPEPAKGKREDGLLDRILSGLLQGKPQQGAVLEQTAEIQDRAQQRQQGEPVRGFLSGLTGGAKARRYLRRKRRQQRWQRRRGSQPTGGAEGK